MSTGNGFRREDVEFVADDGTVLRAWLHLPDGPGPHSAISMAHGYAGTRHHGIERFAEAFAADGHAVLLHDHRGFGASGGVPRQDVDPWTQIADWRRALSFLESRPEVDAGRLGLWGTSYAGGHALVLGATDPRLRAVVAQVPTISGAEQTRRRVRPEDLPAFHAGLLDDERARAAGRPVARRAIVSTDPDTPASYRAPDAVAFYLQDVPAGVWANEVTVRSTLAATTYEPGVYVDRVSPTPLLMVVATDDTVTLTDTALAAYERAREPKRLVLVPGGHFDPYLAGFDAACGAARTWFADHLAPRKD
ncbi:peptidase S15 [Pseudonocardia sp. Ae406_Ps2]|uniref:alpha/beta hydrolase n=1 Tax=unclassified Pseudonocardia TaxID=2619320 RepID=UPI00094B191A|nr:MULTISPECIES: alpha/beta hydrolase [unclassified Pseudonocardia]OLL98042.1 peptidase S15 [Pseudonocardia sp. Ae331_Ps2]OLM04249.1 peptidase S15 [Pseudonocardia sp. Ae406_Ps2]OLM10916.1 peptidase S15 [Pseudonocardia sp. Ae505_Ps2]OLM25810.1 peptidase S15 [Pseudonocardia sp. Ae706_Ps2]OLM34053.1 peptidase S15 [Pseudonocardia sp. Ae717_Ps2]